MRVQTSSTFFKIELLITFWLINYYRLTDGSKYVQKIEFDQDTHKPKECPGGAPGYQQVKGNFQRTHNVRFDGDDVLVEEKFHKENDKILSKIMFLCIIRQHFSSLEIQKFHFRWNCRVARRSLRAIATPWRKTSALVLSRKISIFTKSKYNLKNSFRFEFHFFQHNFFRWSVQFIFFKTGDAAFENVLRGDPSRELDSKFGTGALSSADTKPGADSSASADV